MINSRQRGMALLIVLLTIATLSSLVAFNQQRWLQTFQRNRTSQFLLQAKWQLLGAEAIILSRLSSGKEAVFPLRHSRYLQLDELRIAYTFSSREVCFNLNALLAPHNKYDNKQSTVPISPTPSAAMLHAAATLPRPGSDTAALSTTRPEDPYPQRVFMHLLHLAGASADQTIDLLATLTTRNRSHARFVDASEIRPLIDYDLWQRLAPFICALPDNQLRINLNALTAAQSPLLSALLLETLSPSQAGALLHSRPAEGWKHADQLDALWPADDTFRAAVNQARSSLALDGIYYTLRLWLEEEDRRFQISSQLLLNKQRLQITERHYGLSE